MVNECIFCKIVRGEIPSYTLYEDDEIMVFLDAFPISKGHTLFIPKNHYEMLYNIEQEKMQFLRKLPEISKKLKKITKASGMNIWQNNEKDAGQIINHVHFHLIPRYPNDNLFSYPEQKEHSKEESLKLVEAFKQA